jgi:hypothetical protein
MTGGEINRDTSVVAGESRVVRRGTHIAARPRCPRTGHHRRSPQCEVLVSR